MRRDDLYVADLADTTRAICEYLDGISRAQWDEDRVLRDAVLTGCSCWARSPATPPGSVIPLSRSSPVTVVVISGKVSIPRLRATDCHGAGASPEVGRQGTCVRSLNHSSSDAVTRHHR
jgi:hypothetical protein